MGNRWETGGSIKWLDYGVLETILLYRLGWDLCILAVIGSAQVVVAYSGFTVNPLP